MKIYIRIAWVVLALLLLLLVGAKAHSQEPVKTSNIQLAIAIKSLEYQVDRHTKFRILLINTLKGGRIKEIKRILKNREEDLKQCHP